MFGLFKKKKDKEEEVISRLFHYSFDEINWEYSGLTEREKRLVSPKEFESLKKRFKR